MIRAFASQRGRFRVRVCAYPFSLYYAHFFCRSLPRSSVKFSETNPVRSPPNVTYRFQKLDERTARVARSTRSKKLLSTKPGRRLCTRKVREISPIFFPRLYFTRARMNFYGEATGREGPYLQKLRECSS